ncbi:MAG TPA: rRNA pseudouridine synthase [Fluviicoccus sp.]|nr:rRNA pseudouridine synthase [Fluviicoccus sp.]
MTESVRLSKFLAEQLACSRRDAELYIEGGWVTVDGEVVDEAHFRVQGQRVELLPGAKAEPLPPVTILLNKLPGYQSGDGGNPAAALISPATLSGADRSGLRPLKRHFSRLTPTLPLETDAEGLTVYSQDWRVLRKLEEDAAIIEQEYIVSFSGDLTGEALALLNHGLVYEGWAIPPMKVSRQSETRLRFALKDNQPGQIAWMCEQVGLEVTAMKRIRIGRLPMAGLEPGHWRYLLGYERF